MRPIYPFEVASARQVSNYLNRGAFNEEHAASRKRVGTAVAPSMSVIVNGSEKGETKWAS
jgi:hypothetical protein